MRAISAFIFECGITTVSCRAIPALRMRVKKSAMGSLTLITLPTRLHYTGDLPLVRQLSQADPAQTELPVIAVRPATPLAPVVLPDLELLRLPLLHQQRFSRHRSISLTRPKRHTQHAQELPGLLVGLRRRHHRHVQTPRGVYGVVGDLREDGLFPQAQCEVAAAVEGAGADPPEVPHARERDGYEPVQELPHPLAPKRNPRPDRHAVPDLEPGDALSRAPELRLLAGDPRQVLHRAVEPPAVLRGLPNTHVHHDLLELRYAHRVLYLEPILEGQGDLLPVPILQPSHLCPSRSSWRRAPSARSP